MSSCSLRRRSIVFLHSCTSDVARATFAASSRWRALACASSAAAAAAFASARACSACTPTMSTSLVVASICSCLRSRLEESVAWSSPSSASAASRAADAATRASLSSSRRGLSRASSASSALVSFALRSVFISWRRSAACASRSPTVTRIAATVFSLTPRDSSARCAAYAHSFASARSRSIAVWRWRRADSARWMSPSTAVTACSAACSLSFTSALSLRSSARTFCASRSMRMFTMRERPESW
mmetsp:Transcript_7998/g.34026  ORF Transcript_7998/g.34026 Transcript_7998/m.34026 type:complete len:243 (+) Transcript_7998:1048-1776(+)